jgi:lipoprotein-anchoring transpeptidase ErfK/SrfK
MLVLGRLPSMRCVSLVIGLGLLGCGQAGAQALLGPPLAPPPGPLGPSQRYVQPRMVVVAQPQAQPDLGGGFIEYLFGDSGRGPAVVPPTAPPPDTRPLYVYAAPQASTEPLYNPANPRQMDPKYLRQEVAYQTTEAPGTIVIDTPNKFLYLVEPGGKAMRYGIGVGRPGFTWSGTHKISAKREWPDWTPPEEMLQRQPYLPRHMEGGPNNPLGARALYLGSTLYRIHGSNEPWTIGHNVSSGCIRLRNEDVIDLYSRVNVGTKVVVM